MSPLRVQRELALTGIALLAAVGSLALASRSGSESRDPSLPEPVTVAGGWYQALAGPSSRNATRKRTACGQRVGPGSLGVGNPVLPCRAKIFIAYGDKEVLTQVLDRGPEVPGREFDLTPALADRLGIHGVQRIRWTFARAG